MSSKYQVAAPNIVGVEQGNTITEADLPDGTNVQALVASGALVPVKSRTKATEPADTEEAT